MKKMIFLALLVLSSYSSAGCLDSASNAFYIVTEIKGVYVPGDNMSDTGYVLIDRQNCELKGTPSVALGAETKSIGYLTFKKANSELFSALLTAKTTKEKVSFRILDSVSGYNPISYLLMPADAFNGIVY